MKTKTCEICHNDLPHNVGPSRRFCDTCRAQRHVERTLQWRSEHPEATRIANARYAQEHKDERNARQRGYDAKRRARRLQTRLEIKEPIDKEEDEEFVPLASIEDLEDE